MDEQDTRFKAFTEMEQTTLLGALSTVGMELITVGLALPSDSDDRATIADTLVAVTELAMECATAAGKDTPPREVLLGAADEIRDGVLR